MHRLLIVGDAEYMRDMLTDVVDPTKYEVVGTGAKRVFMKIVHGKKSLKYA